jgi:tetratricopeptide (TPR) repeat protein
MMTITPFNRRLIVHLGVAVVAVFLLSIAFYGSYLPYRKSSLFIETMKTVRSSRSLADFESALRVPLDAPSPIGQEELVRNTAGLVLNVIQGNGTQPGVAEEILRFLKEYFNPIIDRGRGMSFSQNLYVLGLSHTTAFDKTHNSEFLKAAENYFSQAYLLGPDRPQSLYGLFGIYRAIGDKKRAIEFGNRIVELWPTDVRTKANVDQIVQSLP